MNRLACIVACAVMGAVGFAVEDIRGDTGPAKPSSVNAGLDFVGTWELEAGSLRDALTFISERIGVPILLDGVAFQGAGYNDIESQTVKISKLPNTRARDVLRLLLSQVGGDFLVNDGQLIAVPQQCTAPDRIIRRPVDLSLEDATLAKAFQRLSEVTDISIILDSRCADRATAAVPASFHHVPLETAVRVLADMADLKAVVLDNALYVTTKANAAALQAEQDQRYRSRVFVPTFGDCVPPAPEPANKPRQATTERTTTAAHP